MRASISIGLVLVLSTITLHSQVIAGVGIKGGISLANQSHHFTPINYTIETQSIATPSAALFIEVFSRKYLSYQLDLSYVTKGSKTTTESVTVNHLENDLFVVNLGDLTVSKFSYFVFSPMVRFRFDQNHLTPYLMLGPRIDYLLNYKTESVHPLEVQHSFILGLSGGVGVEFNLNNLGLFLEVQVQPDLSTVTNQAPLLINNNILLISLGIRHKSSS